MRENTYKIHYGEFTDEGYERHDLGTATARTGLDAIRVKLAERGVEPEIIAEGRSVGSNKRLVIAGITFQADKVAA